MVNRQCGVGNSNVYLNFCIETTDHVISRMRNDDLHWSGSLEPNISKLLDMRYLRHATCLVTMEHE